MEKPSDTIQTTCKQN